MQTRDIVEEWICIQPSKFQFKASSREASFNSRPLQAVLAGISRSIHCGKPVARNISFSRKPIACNVFQIIIQQIVTLPKYGHDALDIRNRYPAVYVASYVGRKSEVRKC